MNDITPQPQKFIDGVIQLHSQLDAAFNQAAQIAHQLIGTPSLSEESQKSFSLYVDPREEHPSNQIRGYLMTKNTILRFLPIVFDKALLFPVRNHGGGSFKAGKGVSINHLDNLLEKKVIARIRFSPIREVDGLILFNTSIYSTIALPTTNTNHPIDDIGNPFYKFPDLEQLSLTEIPSWIKNRTFTLTEKESYAPFTKNTEINCVLFAQMDKQYDKDVIKVLRWFPAKKGIASEQSFGLVAPRSDVFFELGYISPQENHELHAYMISSNSRLLFGTVKNDLITVEGGVKTFQTNQFNYPACLYNIKLI